MQSRKSIRPASKSQLSAQNLNTTPSIPLLPYIVSFLSLIDWVNHVNINHEWHVLLHERCQELVKLKVLPALRLRFSYQDLIVETQKKILKSLETSSVAFQIQLLRAAIYHLQIPASFSLLLKCKRTWKKRPHT